jgi:hypothetical protein
MYLMKHPPSAVAHVLPAAALTVALWGVPAFALARFGPFSDFAGPWFGAGRIYTANGAEPIRCRARYTVGKEGDLVRQTMVCASPSYRFSVDSTVRDHDGTVSGTWMETTRRIEGQIQGVAGDGRIEASIRGQSFAANLRLVTHGNTQAVTIVPQGTDVREVTVRLRRG